MGKRTREEICQAMAQDFMDFLELIIEGQQKTPDTTRIYTFDELAKMFGKSKSTIRQWVCAGEFGEPVKVGSSTRVTQMGLEKFLSDHTSPTQRRPSRVQTRTTKVMKTHQGQPLGI